LARKILLADDSVTAQNMGRKILTDAGYDVITVNNGSAALKRVGEHKPDLIVLDVYMPGYSGLEVCARLKDAPDTSRIPILLTVGKLEPFKPEEASRVRADAFIVKPFEASELLSALTRLEDRMVPQADGVRFSTTVSGIERFSAGDPAVRQTDPEETGWKNRLRFPSKKKKEEPEPDPEEDFGTTPYRDFKKGKGKAPARGSFAVNSAPAPGQEPGLVPDIPRDITPEELDALSELVAKLDGPIPAAENIAPLGEHIAAIERPATPKPDENKPEESKQEEISQDAAPAEELTPAAEVPAVAAEAVTEAAAAETDTEVAPVAAVSEAALAESAVTEPEPAPLVAAQEVPPVAQESVPTEGTAAAEIAPVADISESVRNVVKEFSVVASPEAVVAAPPIAAPESAAPPEEVAEVEAPKVEATPQVEENAEPASAAASAGVVEEPATPAPSPEDLAEALRLLTPSQGGQTLAEAGAALAEELARGSTPETRWVAENVALSPEEASLSLEAEMFKSFATGPGAAPATGGDGIAASSPVRYEEEEAAEAAVEAAEAEAAPAGEVVVHTETAQAQAAEAAQSETLAEAQSEASPAELIEEAAQEEVAGVTFADAIRGHESEEGTSAVAESAVAGDDELGGSDDMAKDAKGKGKWHQIHSTPEPAAKTDVVEAAKAEEAPKAMAAAASAEGTSEASAIASIVDSVLADLKPKIVEEIAKKLAKK
jgi:CheY-like chemotaxis protein